MPERRLLLASVVCGRPQKNGRFGRRCLDKMRVPLVDLARENEALTGQIREVFDQVLSSGTYVLGPRLREFEKTIAEFHGVAYAVGVNSCTDALFLALRSLGIHHGDEVLVPATTFVATANAVVFCGATPVFVEVEEDTLNLDPRRLEAAITPATKAILVVHFHGHPADMDEILRIAEANHLSVVEDCAQAFGATYRSHRVGGLGTLGCLSFYPTKHLGGVGDGGMILTNDEEAFRAVHSLRNYGETDRYVYGEIGFNSRLDELQAGILAVKLQHVVEATQRRRLLAHRYNELLAELPVDLPCEKDYAGHAFWVYTIRLSSRIERERAQRHLEGCGIGTHIFYPICVPDQKPYRGSRNEADPFSISRDAANRMLAIPLFPRMTEEEQDHVVTCLGEALNS